MGATMSEVIVEERPALRVTFYYAGFWIRLVAFVFDMIVVNSLSTIVGKFLETDLELGFGISLGTVIYWLITFAYFTLTTYFTNGQTLGKMIMNIRVISTDGNRLNLWQVVSRETFGRYIQNKFKVLYLIIGLTPSKQSIIDMLADTEVVKIDQYEYVKSNSRIL